MFTIDKERAKQILTTELGYSSSTADVYLKNYPQIHDELFEVVDHWLKNRIVLDTPIMGISIPDVMKSQGYHFLTAIREVNHLLGNDIAPEQRERMAKRLTQPIPRW